MAPMSSLQRQLAALAAQTGSRAALGGQRGAAPGAAAGGTLKASLVFDAAEAADMDAADVHAVAANGLEELASRDARLGHAARPLFARSLVEGQQDVDTLPPDEAAALDDSLQRVLRLIGPHMESPAAHKVLEYLFRRFRANERNVGALLAAALPYHDSKFFVRLVRCLALEGTRFEFLGVVARSGAPLPREVLVRRCTHDHALLLGLLAEGHATGAQGQRAVAAFATVLLCETLAAMDVATGAPLDEVFVAKLLPLMAQGVAKGAHPELAAGYYMAAVALAARTQLSEEPLAALGEAIAKGASDALATPAMLCLAALVQAQGDAALPVAAFRALVRLPRFAETAVAIARGGRSPFFVGAILRLLAEHCGANVHYERATEKLLRAAPLGASAAAVAARVLIDAAAEEEAEHDGEDEGNGDGGAAGTRGSNSGAARRLLGAMQELFPEPLAVALAAHAKDCTPATAEGGKGGKARRKKGGSDAAGGDVGALAPAGSTFRCDGVHAPVDEAGGAPILTALDAARPKARRAALKVLAEQLAGDGGDVQLGEGAWRPVLAEALLRRVTDEVSSVARAALRCPVLLPAVPPGALLAALRAVAQAAAEAPDSEARANGKLAVKLIGGAFVHAHGETHARSAWLALAELAMVLPRARKVGRAAARAACYVRAPDGDGHVAMLPDAPALDWWPSHGDDDAEDGEEEEADDAPKKKGGKRGKTAQAEAEAAAAEREAAARDGDRDRAVDDARISLGVASCLSAWMLADPATNVPPVAAALRASSPPPPMLLLACVGALGACDDADAAAIVAAMEAPALNAWEGAVDGGVSAEVDGLAGLPDAAREVEAGAGGLPTPAALAAAVRHSGGSPAAMAAYAARAAVLALVVRAPLMDPASMAPARVAQVVLGAQHGADIADVMVQRAQESDEVDLAALLSAVLTRGAPGAAVAAATRLAAADELQDAAEEAPAAVLGWLLLSLSRPERRVRKAAMGVVKVLAAVAAPTAKSKGKGKNKGGDRRASLSSLEGAQLSAALARALVEASQELTSDSLAAAAVASAALAEGNAAGAGGAPDSASRLALTSALCARAAEDGCPADEASALLAASEGAGWHERQVALVAPLLARCVDTLAAGGGAEGGGALVELVSSCLRRYSPLAAPALTSDSEALRALLLAVKAGGAGGDVIRASSPALFSAMPSDEERTALLLGLLKLAQRTADAGLRERAQGLLGELPLPPDFLAPLLEWTDGKASSAEEQRVEATPPPKKRSRAKKSAVAIAAGAAARSGPTRSLNDVVAVLQLVQSRPALARAALVAPLLRLLRATVAACASAAPSGAENAPNEPVDAGARDATAASAQYAQLLSLHALEGIVSRARETAEAVEVPVEGVELIVDSARTTSDGAVRSAALGALAAVAQVDPQQALDHVMEVVSLAGQRSMATASASGWRAVQSALEAVVLAWAEAGGADEDSDVPLDAMLRSFVTALGAAPAPQRTPLAATMARALPDSAMPSVLLALLEHPGAGGGDDIWDAAETAAALCVRLRPADRAAVCAELMTVAAEGPLLAAAAAFAADVAAAPSAAALHAEDAEAITTHADLLQAAVAALADAREDDAGAAAALEVLVSGLRRRLPLPDYLAALASIAEGASEELRPQALELCAEALLDGPSSADAAYALVGEGGEAAAALLDVARELFEAEAAAEAQGALLCADAIARAARASRAAGESVPEETVEALSDCLAPALEQAHEGRARPAAVVASALAAAASLVAALGSEVTPHVPVAAKSVLGAAEAAVKAVEEYEGDAEAPLRLAAAYTALGSLVESAGGMLAPYMPAILRLLLHPVLCAQEEDSQAATRAAQARAALPLRVPPRVLAAPLSEAVAAAEGAAAAVAAAGLASAFVEALPQREVGEHALAIFGAAQALGVRAAAGELDEEGAEEAAAAARSTAVALVLRTSENVFRPLFHSAMRAAIEASAAAGAAGAEAADEDTPQGDALLPCAETEALLALALDISAALRAVFLPFQSRLLPHLLRLAPPAPGAAVPPTKRRRGKGSQAAAAAEAEAAATRCRVLALRLLSALCSHDADGSVATGQSLERILDAVVAAVEPCAASEAAAEALVAAVASVGRRCGEALHPRLNRGLLQCARDAPEARVRRVAMRGAAALLGALREEYIAMLAESVPILAELLESDDFEVEKLSQEFLADLSEVSGEDIASFMQR